MAFIDLTLQEEFAAIGRRGRIDFEALKDDKHLMAPVEQTNDALKWCIDLTTEGLGENARIDIDEDPVHYLRSLGENARFDILGDPVHYHRSLKESGENFYPRGRLRGLRVVLEDPAEAFERRAKRQRRGSCECEAPPEAVDAWREKVRDALFDGHPRMIEFVHFFQKAVRAVDVRAKRHGEMVVLWHVPGHSLTEFYQLLYSGGCKDLFNKVGLEDLLVRQDRMRRRELGLPRRAEDFFADRPSALEGLKRVKARRDREALERTAHME